MKSALKRYKACNQYDLEIETRFRLANTYRLVNCRYHAMRELHKIARKALGKITSPEELIRAHTQIQSICSDINAKWMLRSSLYRSSIISKKISEETRYEFLNKLLETLKMEYDPENILFKDYDEAMNLTEKKASLFNLKESIFETEATFLGDKYGLIKNKFKLSTYPRFYTKVIKNLYSSELMNNESEMKYNYS